LITTGTKNPCGGGHAPTRDQKRVPADVVAAAAIFAALDDRAMPTIR